MEDFKIYIFVIQKSFLCSLGEISLVYYLHIHFVEKKCGICLIFFSNLIPCPFDVLFTKEQLVDESLGEAFLGGPQTPRPIFSPPSVRRF